MNNNLTHKKSVLALTVMISMGASQAFAFDMNEVNESSFEKAFKALDADNSQSLSPAEASKLELFTKKHFGLADANNDGSLSQEEFTNYKSKVENKNVKRIAKDSAITSKIKTKLLVDEGLKSLKVSVETHQGIVILSGFVKTAEQIKQAESIASETDGVKSVKNRLELKKED